MPKNKADSKVKIINVLLALRKMDRNGRFELEQTKFLTILSSMWGSSQPSKKLHSNDRVRIYGIMMEISKYCPLYERLVEGCTARKHIDDPVFSLQQIFQKVAFQFNNKHILIELPMEAYDIDVIEEINDNDGTRIWTTRDCECLILLSISFVMKY